MTREEIFTKLKEIFNLVVCNGIDTEKVTTDCDIMLDLGVNSIGLIYMVVAIEKTFDIDMSEVTFTTFKTIDDVITYIQERTK